MNAINKNENARMEREKGDAALEEAQILFNSEKYDGSVTRAYYAVFHYACAALFTRGLEANSHCGMQRLFHLHFIRTKIFDEDFGLILSHAQKAREEADYYPEITFSEKIAKERLHDAERFVKKVKSFLK